MSVKSDKWFLQNFNNKVRYDVWKEGEELTERNKDVTVADLIMRGILPRQGYNNVLKHLHTQSPLKQVSVGHYNFAVSQESPLPMIYPFTPESINTFPDGRKIPSYGLSSYGYDIRLGRSFKVFAEAAKPFIGDMGNMTAVYHSSPFYTQTYEEIDILNFPKNIGVDFNDVDSVVIPPRGFALGVAMEYLDIPDDKVVICMAKSTLARMALDMSVTPVEPGWKGYLTLEITNKTAFPMLVHSGVGAMQLMFLDGDEECLVSYASRQGKYQNQPAIPVGPRL